MTSFGTLAEILTPLPTPTGFGVEGYPHIVYSPLPQEKDGPVRMVYTCPRDVSLSKKMIETIAKRVIHDVNNPLAAILTLTEMAEMYLPTSESEDYKSAIAEYQRAHNQARIFQASLEQMADHPPHTQQLLETQLKQVGQQFWALKAILGGLPPTDDKDFNNDLITQLGTQENPVDRLLQGLTALAQEEPISRGLYNTKWLGHYFQIIAGDLKKYGLVDLQTQGVAHLSTTQDLAILYTQILNLASNSAGAFKKNDIGDAKNRLPRLVVNAQVRDLAEQERFYLTSEERAKYDPNTPFLFVGVKDDAGGINFTKIAPHQMFEAGQSTGSTGLGLALSGRVLHHLGGFITVETAGNGTKGGYTSITHVIPLNR
ncbi:sensor histidine kinase [Candidatus Woesearchaeota archaeon]|nr:sensor histidine kinase [Candidatus Woesearchaeota archaeon]